MKGKLLMLFLLGYVIAANAQSRSPQITFTDAPIKESHLKDSLEMAYEERPYFLLISQSEEALGRGDYEAAALRLVEAMSVEPENPLNVAVMSNLGMLYYYNGQDTLALQVLDKAVERAPRMLAPREGRARILLTMGKDREAFKEYSDIIEIDSLNTDSRFMRAMISLYHGDMPTAKVDIDLLTQVVPLTRNTLLAQATYAMMDSNNIEAISLFRKLIEMDSAPEYYSNMVKCMLAVDNLADASETLGKALEKYPRDPELYYYRAVLNMRRYLKKEAIEDAKRAIELGADPKKVKELFESY